MFQTIEEGNAAINQHLQNQTMPLFYYTTAFDQAAEQTRLSPQQRRTPIQLDKDAELKEKIQSFYRTLTPTISSDVPRKHSTQLHLLRVKTKETNNNDASQLFHYEYREETEAETDLSRPAKGSNLKQTLPQLNDFLMDNKLFAPKRRQQQLRDLGVDTYTPDAFDRAKNRFAEFTEFVGQGKKQKIEKSIQEYYGTETQTPTSPASIQYQQHQKQQQQEMTPNRQFLNRQSNRGSSVQKGKQIDLAIANTIQQIGEQAVGNSKIIKTRSFYQPRHSILEQSQQAQSYLKLYQKPKKARERSPQLIRALAQSYLHKLRTVKGLNVSPHSRIYSKMAADKDAVAAVQRMTEFTRQAPKQRSVRSKTLTTTTEDHKKHNAILFDQLLEWDKKRQDMIEQQSIIRNRVLEMQNAENIVQKQEEPDEGNKTAQKFRNYKDILKAGSNNKTIQVNLQTAVRQHTQLEAVYRRMVNHYGEKLKNEKKRL